MKKLFLLSLILSMLLTMASCDLLKSFITDGESSYYHLVFTEYGKETVSYDIYYRLDKNDNTTAIYMKETIGSNIGGYQSIRERLCLPYDSYFDLPLEIYD